MGDIALGQTLLAPTTLVLLSSFHQYYVFILIFKATLNRRANGETCGPSNNSDDLNGERGVLTKKTFSLLFVLWGGQ